jgi:YHS domain-containing protein
MFGKKEGVRDPICGMTVDPRTAIKSDINGQTYYFCSEDCKKQFEGKTQKEGQHSMDHRHGGCC